MQITIKSVIVTCGAENCAHHQPNVDPKSGVFRGAWLLFQDRDRLFEPYAGGSVGRPLKCLVSSQSQIFDGFCPKRAVDGMMRQLVDMLLEAVAILILDC